MTPLPVITTDRLILRPHNLDDFDAMYAMQSDPEVMRHIGTPRTREESWHRLLRYTGHWALFGFGLFAIHDRDSGRFAGEAGLMHFGRELGPGFDEAPEAGWILARWAQGQGIAQEATAAAHRWIDETRQPTRTVCIIDPGNAPSIALAGKLGYRLYGQTVYHGSNVGMYERLAG